MDLHDEPEREIMAAIAGRADGLHDELLDEAAAAIADSPPMEAFVRLMTIFAHLGEVLADLLAGALLAASVAGRARVVARLPASPLPLLEPAPPSAGLSLDRLLESFGSVPAHFKAAYLEALPPATAARLEGASGGPPPVREVLASAGLPEPDIHLPLIERGVEVLRAKNLMSHRDLASLAASARTDALAVAGNVSTTALAKLQPLLVESVRAGAEPRAFRAAVEEALPGVMSPGAIETTFRDAVQAAYSGGQDAVLANPTVGDAFPYEETLPIHDSRLSTLCAVVSRSGIQQTGIFRRDDPTWARVKPPRHPRCRCGRNPLTLRMAARKGIREAEAWLKSGRPPAWPEWVPMPEIAVKGGL